MEVEIEPRSHHPLRHGGHHHSGALGLHGRAPGNRPLADPAPCEDVKSAQKLDLEAGSYVFEIGPATKSDVAIVIE
jgi:hypothetical protein